MRKKRRDNRQFSEPSLNGWSMFAISNTGIPTLIHGHMLATQLQFTPYRETIVKSPGFVPYFNSFTVTGSMLGNTYTMRWMIFQSFFNSIWAGYTNMPREEITAVTGGGRPTVTRTVTNVVIKDTKNVIRVHTRIVNDYGDYTVPVTIPPIESEVAIGRF